LRQNAIPRACPAPGSVTQVKTARGGDPYTADRHRADAPRL